MLIDEAYLLISSSESDYGKEAVATFLKRIEDNGYRLVVIPAGYTAQMQSFIDSNPRLQSRFNRHIEFPDYSDEKLFQVSKEVNLANENFLKYVLSIFRVNNSK